MIPWQIIVTVISFHSCRLQICHNCHMDLRLRHDTPVLHPAPATGAKKMTPGHRMRRFQNRKHDQNFQFRGANASPASHDLLIVTIPHSSRIPDNRLERRIYSRGQLLLLYWKVDALCYHKWETNSVQGDSYSAAKERGMARQNKPTLTSGAQRHQTKAKMGWRGRISEGAWTKYFSSWFPW